VAIAPINVLEPNGHEPLAICRRAREDTVARCKGTEILALNFFTTTSEPDADASLTHIHRCPRCRAWFHAVVPEPILRRQHRQSQYCCAGMFVAVEEWRERPNSIRFSFELYRGEDPCWKIGEKLSFASYCPWCGRKLPGKPFLSDAPS
jgi:hypothetical protein